MSTYDIQPDVPSGYRIDVREADGSLRTQLRGFTSHARAQAWRDRLIVEIEKRQTKAESTPH